MVLVLFYFGMAKLSVYDMNLLTGQTVTILNLILADNLLNFLPEVAYGSIEKNRTT